MTFRLGFWLNWLTVLIYMCVVPVIWEREFKARVSENSDIDFFYSRIILNLGISDSCESLTLEIITTTMASVFPESHIARAAIGTSSSKRKIEESRSFETGQSADSGVDFLDSEFSDLRRVKPTQWISWIHFIILKPEQLRKLHRQ